MSEIDRAMLQSMAASFRGALEFSFNRHDMAKLMDRCATRTDLSQASVVAALERAVTVELTPTGRRLRRRAERIPPAVIDRLGMEVSELEDIRDRLSTLIAATRRTG